MVRVAAIAVLLSGVVALHHGAHPGGIDEAHPEAASLSGEVVQVGFQDGAAHFEPVASGGTGTGDHDAGGVPELLYLCLAVLVVVLGWRVPSGRVTSYAGVRPRAQPNPATVHRPMSLRWGVRLLLSVCVWRT